MGWTWTRSENWTAWPPDGGFRNRKCCGCAIEAVAREQAEGAPSPLEALGQLQKTLKLTEYQAGKWSLEVRQERVKSSERRE